MGNPAIDAFSFLLGTVFDIYAMVVAVRFLMQAVRADYYNPLSQFVVKVTDPVLIPLRRLIPGFGGYDIAALVLCLSVIFLKLMVFKLLGLDRVGVAGYLIAVSSSGLVQLLIMSFVDLINLLFNIFIVGAIILAIMSWIVPDPRHPAYALLGSLINPLLTPVKRLVPPIGGLDLSVLVLILGLSAIKMLVVGLLVRLF